MLICTSKKILIFNILQIPTENVATNFCLNKNFTFCCTLCLLLLLLNQKNNFFFMAIWNNLLSSCIASQFRYFTIPPRCIINVLSWDTSGCRPSTWQFLLNGNGVIFLQKNLHPTQQFFIHSTIFAKW